jgi:hypothetical protein
VTASSGLSQQPPVSRRELTIGSLFDAAAAAFAGPFLS